jgi:hypothetical protein
MYTFYSNIENLVLRAKSENIGFATIQSCSWFQVSVNTEAETIATGLVTTEGQ